MERFVKYSTIVVIVIALTFIGLYLWQRPIPLTRNVSISDEDYILMTLRAKHADDCVLREIRPGVWSCTERRTGRIFMVRR
jgi:hypothetical protein